jgi:hypothetical protein
MATITPAPPKPAQTPNFRPVAVMESVDRGLLGSGRHDGEKTTFFVDPATMTSAKSLADAREIADETFRKAWRHEVSEIERRVPYSWTPEQVSRRDYYEHQVDWHAPAQAIMQAADGAFLVGPLSYRNGVVQIADEKPVVCEDTVPGMFLDPESHLPQGERNSALRKVRTNITPSTDELVEIRGGTHMVELHGAGRTEHTERRDLWAGQEAPLPRFIGKP